MATAIEERALPSFTLAERDRRWGRVRALMAEAGIDVLVAPPNNGSNDKFQADARYLTQFGLNGELAGCIFPLNGPVIGFGGPSAKLLSRWIEDVRSPRRTFNDAIIGALGEIGADRATIGVCGLDPGIYNLMRAPDGVVGSRLMDQMRATFPNARIVSATDLMGEARIVKSAEEVAFLETAAAIADAGMEALLRTARPGVKESAVYGAIVAAELELDCTFPFMLAWLSGPYGDVYGRLNQATGRILRDGDIILNEIEGRWGGYTAQIDQSTFVGRVANECRDAWKVAAESFERTVAAMKPGVTFGEMRAACAATPAVNGWQARLVLHGRGLGDEGPLITTPPFAPGVMERPLQEGNAFVIKPAVERNGEGDAARFGDSVVVTAAGARRLGRRPLDFAHYHVGV
jgi:Xaa-Pro aminopeptidase